MQADDQGEQKKLSLGRRAGLGVLGAAIGAVGGYFMFGEAIGMVASALIVGAGLAIGLGGNTHDGGAGGGDGGGAD